MGIKKVQTAGGHPGEEA